jgi:hypothetical protein
MAEKFVIMPSFEYRFFLALLLAVSCLGGCDGQPKTFQVTGTVTYHNKPVEGARVMFIPANNRPASGLTDAQGRFTLLSFAVDDGAVAGEHVVCITKAALDGKDTSGSPYPQGHFILPLRYSTPLKTPLKVTVNPAGSNDFRFDLAD